jgi:GMP synthase-like glutamine amidotransferase
MKPVVIFRHARTEGAGYLGTFLEQHDIPWCEVRIDKHEPVPESMEAFSGLVLMGGPMSVNDDLPWIPRVLSLIQQAIALDKPVLGHCLGGQLMSKALGGVVAANPVKEIGWGNVSVTNSPEALRWFGDVGEFESFHWHGETFTLPPNATHLLSSQYCINQAYSIGKHLAFQCHVEMTEDMVKVWCETGKIEVLESLSSPAVQPPEVMQDGLQEKIKSLNTQAHKIYTEWIKGLKT